MVIPLQSTTISDLTQVGRASAPDPSIPRVSVSHAANFTASGNITLDFTIINQQQVFGTPFTLFFDNGTNPNPVTVFVSITGQQFTLAPYSIGYYSLNAQQNSTINFQSEGGASAASNLTVFNYVVPPSVWYSYGTSNPVSANAVEGAIVEGSSIPAATSPNPLYVGGKDYGSGLLHGLSVDATGKANTNSAVADGADVTLGAVADASWGGAGNGTVVSVLKALWIALTARQGAYTDRSIAALTGVSQNLMGANAARRFVAITNINAANPVAVNLTGAAAVLNGAGSLTIAAGNTLRIDNFPPNTAITVIGTAADKVTAYEG